MKEFKAPNYTNDIGIRVFLAGTIDNGNSYDWSKDVIKELEDIECIVYNPRRDNWDSRLEPISSNDVFNEQVNWELDNLENSHIIFMNFLPNSKSPISLLELGLFKDKNLIVCCPEGFYRKGNIDIVCDRYAIKKFEDFDEAVSFLREEISRMNDIYNFND